MPKQASSENISATKARKNRIHLSLMVQLLLTIPEIHLNHFSLSYLEILLHIRPSYPSTLFDNQTKVDAILIAVPASLYGLFSTSVPPYQHHHSGVRNRVTFTCSYFHIMLSIGGGDVLDILSIVYSNINHVQYS